MSDDNKESWKDKMKKVQKLSRDQFDQEYRVAKELGSVVDRGSLEGYSTDDIFTHFSLAHRSPYRLSVLARYVPRDDWDATYKTFDSQILEALQEERAELVDDETPLRLRLLLESHEHAIESFIGWMAYAQKLVAALEKKVKELTELAYVPEDFNESD